jgi:hypothetical protein
MQRGLLRWPIWVDIGITFANEITMSFLESKITLVPQDSRPKPFSSVHRIFENTTLY